MPRMSTSGMVIIALLLAVQPVLVAFDRAEGPPAAAGEVAMVEDHEEVFSSISASYPGKTLHVGGAGPDNYTDIQSAVMDAADGDKVFIHPGSYTEGLLVTSEIWIMGDESGVLPKVLPPMPGSTAVKIDTNNVTITGLNFTDFNTAIDTPFSGHNLSRNIFLGNSRDIEINYISPPLSKEHDLYGLTISGNDFRHYHSTDSVKIYYHVTFDGSSSHDFDAGDVTISGNSFFSGSTVQQQVDHSLFVTGLAGGSMDIGEFRLEGNTFIAGGESFRFESRLDRHRDVKADIGDVSLVRNNFRDFDDGAVRIDHYDLNDIRGSSDFRIGDLNILDNDFFSKMGGEAVYLNQWTGLWGLHDGARIDYGNLTFAGNTVNVSSYAIFAEVDDIGYELRNTSSVTVGNIHIHNNTIERSRTGIYLYYLDIGSLHDSSRVTMDRTIVEHNDITSVSSGIYLQFEALGYSMHGASRAVMGDMVLRNNRITSESNGIGIYSYEVGIDMWDWSSFNMGRVMVEHNTLFTPNSNGIVVESILHMGRYLRNWSMMTMGGFVFNDNMVVEARNGVMINEVRYVGSEIHDDSGFSFGGFNITSSRMKVIYAGVLMNTYGSMGEFLTGSARADIYGVRAEGNEITSDGYGIIARMKEICRYVEDSSVAVFSGLSIEGNSIQAELNGITVPEFNMMGTYLYDNATVRIGVFRVSNNTVSSLVDAIHLDQVHMIGYLLYNWSSSDFAGVEISGNIVVSEYYGIYMGSFTYWGYVMFQKARSTSGTIRIEHNMITSNTTAIYITQIGYIGFVLFGEAVVDFEGFSFRFNDLRSNRTAFHMISFAFMGYDMEGSSKFHMGDSEFSNNEVFSADGGIYIESLGYQGSYQRERCSTKTGNISFSGNIIMAMEDSLKFEYLIGNGFVLYGNSSVTVGDLVIAENHLISINGSGLDMTNSVDMGSILRDYSSVTIGSWIISDNEVVSNKTSLDLAGLHNNFRDNGGTTRVSFGGFHIEGNDMTSNSSGMVFISRSMGIGSIESPVIDLGPFHFAENLIYAKEGVVISFNGTVLDEDAELTLGVIEIKNNMIAPSLRDGLNLTLGVETYQTAYFSSSPVNIFGNRFESAEGSVIVVRTYTDRFGSSQLNLGRVIIRENNITGGSVGLEMYGVEGARVYTNNFASNIDQLKLVDSSAFWTSNSMMWYRHKMKNLTNYLGNFWDTFSGPDNNDDGIGDTRYNTGHGFDTNPLMGFVEGYLPPWDDDTPPVVRVLSPVNGAFLRSSSVEVTWEGYDDLLGIDHYETNLDGGEWQDVGFSKKIPYYNLPEGLHAFAVRAFDVAGNQNTSAIKFTVDLTLPSLEILFPADNGYINMTEVMVEWEGFDNLSGVSGYHLKMDNGSWIEVGSLTGYLFTNLTEGKHSVVVKVLDRAGNEITARSVFWIDLTMPEVTIYHPAQGMELAFTSLNAEWSAIDDISGIHSYRVRIDSAPWIEKGKELSHLFLNLSSGQHTLMVSARDGAGNWRTVDVSFVLERSDDIVNITNPLQGARVGSSTLEVRWEILGTVYPLQMVQSRLDGGAWENLSIAYSRLYVGLVDGEHTVDIRIIDRGGNTDMTSVHFTVDLMKPLIIFQSHQGNNAPPGDPVLITFSEPMDPDSMEVGLKADNEEVPFNWTLDEDLVNLTFDISLEGGTKYEIIIKGADLAGNELQETLLFWTATKGTIRGRIVYKDGEPLIGGRVQLDTREEVYSLQNGAFEIEAPPGMRTLTIYDEDGHLLKTFEIEVVAGKVSEFDGDLEVDRYRDDSTSLWWLWILIAAVVLILIVGGIIYLYARSEKEVDFEDGEEDWDDEDYDDEEFADEWDEDELEF
ncbi:MAG: Ig-like domain-containing protein [Thermoplasmatota archaeon]